MSEHESFDTIVNDLKRMCCSSEYMFLYAQAVLAAVENECLSAAVAPINDQKRKLDEITPSADGTYDEQLCSAAWLTCVCLQLLKRASAWRRISCLERTRQ
jgi:hypothetical protein